MHNAGFVCCISLADIVSHSPEATRWLYCISAYPILNTVDTAIQPVTVREGDIWVREKLRVTDREREREEILKQQQPPWEREKKSNMVRNRGRSTMVAATTKKCLVTPALTPVLDNLILKDICENLWLVRNLQEQNWMQQEKTLPVD